MQIVIQSSGIDVTAALRQHVERRLHFALDWAHYHVRKISIRLFDLNGPRGGEDKRCRIQFAVPGRLEVVVEDTEADLYVAIDRAADRAGRTLARRMARQREHRGSPRLSRHAPEASDPVDAGASAPALSQ